MIRLQTCPICEKELAANAAADSPHFPFCGVRCKQIDLMRWSDGKYAIVEPLQGDRLEGDAPSDADGSHLDR